MCFLCVFEYVHMCVCVSEGRRGVKLVTEGWSKAELSVFQSADEKLH